MAELVGIVVKKEVGRGTKSEHDAVMIVTGDGEYKLRRRGGNPFVDPVLSELVGKRIRANGEVDAGQLIMSAWQEIDQEP
jgi:hypothetical protein